MCNVNIQANSKGPDGRPRWRLVDAARKIRTPWLTGKFTDDPALYRGIKLAVETADRNKIVPHRHTFDGEWLIVHTL